MKTLPVILLFFAILPGVEAQNSASHAGNIPGKYLKAAHKTLLEVIHQQWNDNDWENRYFDVYEHQEGFLIAESTYQWRNDARELVEYTEYTYNAHGLLTGKINYSCEKALKIPELKVIYLYNDQNRLVVQTTYLWNEDRWKESGQIIHQYDERNYLSESTTYEWQNGWLPVNRYVYGYYSNGNHATTNIYKWKSSQWEEVAVEHHYYSDYNRLSESVYADIVNGATVNRLSVQYFYDRWQKPAVIIYRKWQSGTFVNQAIRIFEFDEYGNVLFETMKKWENATDWQNDKHYIYIYERVASTEPMADTPLSKILVYPNPFNKQTAIVLPSNQEVYRLAIWNTQGQLLMEISGITGRQYILDKQQLQAGLYIFTLTDSRQKRYSGRLIIQD